MSIYTKRISDKVIKKTSMLWELYSVQESDYELIDTVIFDSASMSSTADAIEVYLVNARRKSFALLLLQDCNVIRLPSFLTDFIVQHTLNSGAIIQDQDSNQITASNARQFTDLSTDSTIYQENWRQLGYLIHFERRIRAGIPANKVIPDSHVELFDNDGDGVKLVLNLNTYQRWIDLANLILEGKSWNEIQSEMFEEYGHAKANGKPYSRTYYYQLVYTPAFWGHSAHNFKAHRFDKWIYQQGEPVPDEVVVYYDTHEPVWKGKLAEKIKDELDTRMEDAANNKLPNERFKELLVCGHCGKTLQMRVDGMWLVWACKKHPDNAIRDRTLHKRISTFLEQLVMQADFAELLSLETDTYDLANLLYQTKHNLEIIPDWIGIFYDRLIRAEIKALQAEYVQLLTFLYVEQTWLKEELKTLTRQHIYKQLMTTQSSAELIESSLKSFWRLEDVLINELFSALLGQNRFVILNREIAGIAKSA